MIVSLFLLFALAMLVGWFASYRWGIILFFIALALSIVWLGHHMTSALSIQL